LFQNTTRAVRYIFHSLASDLSYKGTLDTLSEKHFAWGKAGSEGADSFQTGNNEFVGGNYFMVHHEADAYASTIVSVRSLKGQNCVQQGMVRKWHVASSFQ